MQSRARLLSRLGLRISKGLEMSNSLIECYRSIEESSSKMLSAAQQEDWARVEQFEGVCAVLIGQLRERARSEELELEDRREKCRIMQRILINDAQIRDLAEPWIMQMEQLGQTIMHRTLH